MNRLLPVRMLNEYTYCPRLFALEWLHGEWAESADTIEGSAVHRRVDREDSRPLEGEDAPVSRRSVHLSDETLGLTAKIDLLEIAGDAVQPVDYKRGRPAPNEHGAWDPERVQVCAQALLLRANGFRCDTAVLYFAGARTRVEIPIDEELVALTLSKRDAALELLQTMEMPPPLKDSPKCPRCSLVGICLPDEHHRLKDPSHPQVRPLLPARDDSQPLYVQQHGGKVGKRAGEVQVRSRDGELLQRVPLGTLSQVCLLGNVSISTPLLRELASRDIPVSFHGYGGWFYGHFTPASGRNVITRIAQHKAAADAERSLSIAKALITGKIHNQRVMLRRNGLEVEQDRLQRLKELKEQVGRCSDLDQARGVEGAAARAYFADFPKMLRGEWGARFAAEGRSRRPPMDPVNALLSFSYSCLVRELTQAVTRVGLDAYVGFLHLPRHGRPSLALDLMEEFRPLVADSVVVSSLNNGVFSEADFVERSTGVSLTKAGRASLIQAVERRLSHTIRHPLLGTTLSYRRILEVQVRLLGKVLLGELDEYPRFEVR